MIRGKTTFKCSECGKHFTALDIEWNATALSVPQKCPQCGSMHTLPYSRFSIFDLESVYKKIWQRYDNREM